MSILNNLKTQLSNLDLFYAHPRINRTKFLFMKFITALGFLLIFCGIGELSTFGIATIPFVKVMLIAILFISTIALVINSICLIIRRLHDINLSGLWVIAGFIPLIGFALEMVLLFVAGTKGVNSFGDQPEKSPRKFLIANYVFALLSAALIAFAVMISSDGRHYQSNNLSADFPYPYSVYHESSDGIATDVISPKQDNVDTSFMISVRSKEKNSNANISYFPNFLTMDAHLFVPQVMFSLFDDNNVNDIKIVSDTKSLNNNPPVRTVQATAMINGKPVVGISKFYIDMPNQRYVHVNAVYHSNNPQVTPKVVNQFFDSVHFGTVTK